jgi:hypothetical protein
MKEATHPSTDSTLNMTEHMAEYEDSLSRWQIRRIDVSPERRDEPAVFNKGDA